MKPCPCRSGKLFSECCQPIINSASAPTAEVLMRSRFSAYATSTAAYIIDTWHPSKQHLYTIQDIAEWANANQWDNLEIIAAEKGTDQDITGMVEFKAYYTDVQGCAHILHERSFFDKIDGKWFYTDGTINPSRVSEKISRNALCPCESGKKYKKCCGT